MLILQLILALLALCGLGYYMLCLWATRSFLRRQKPAPGFTPPVSILKPLRGADPEAYAAFRSHCLQDYPDFELIFGVSDPGDPAIRWIEQLRAEFPQRRIELVVCPRSLGANRKVSNLVQMLPSARYDHLLINDSDMLVPPDYLRCVMAAFDDSDVGLVTSLYRGVPAPTLGSRLESVGISTEFMPGVLAARHIEGGIHFALGSTLALDRRALQAIGGFEPLLDYLADDFELGKRIAAAGLRVELADTVVDTHLPAYSLRGFFSHQLRWGRSTRNSRPAGYLGVLLTFGFVWTLLTLLAARGAPWAWALFGVTAALRLALAWFVGVKVLRDPAVPRLFWLVPLRDLVGLVVWLGSYTGRTVTWRGEKFILENARIRPVHPSPK